MYRCYVLVHSFLSPAQKAVQSAHAVAELFNNEKGLTPHPSFKHYHDFNREQWVTTDKTLILLEGGNTESLQKFIDCFNEYGLDSVYPFAVFKEDWPTLGGLLTSCAFILPKRIWSYSNKSVDEMIAAQESGTLSPRELWLVHDLSSRNLLMSGV